MPSQNVESFVECFDIKGNMIADSDPTDSGVCCYQWKIRELHKKEAVMSSYICRNQDGLFLDVRELGMFGNATSSCFREHVFVRVPANCFAKYIVFLKMRRASDLQYAISML